MQSTELLLKERKSFGDNVRALRKERKLSQEKLSELVDLSPAYLGKIERGECDTTEEMIAALSSALKCSKEALRQ